MTLTRDDPNVDVWRCVRCGARGPYDDVSETDCPEGKARFYGADEAQRLEIFERDASTHVEKFVVWRMEEYESDPNWEMAKSLKDQAPAEVLCRLGALRGHWVAHSKIDDGYIAKLDEAQRILAKGIIPQKRTPRHNVCSIGFCEREQKWYGWSHRAMYGFGIGDVVEEGDLATTSGYTDAYLAEHPEADISVPAGFECKTLDDCRRVAEAFAEAVG
jgi:hypothetical protein